MERTNEQLKEYTMPIWMHWRKVCYIRLRAEYKIKTVEFRETEKMEIKKIEGDFTICKVDDFSEVNYEAEYCFIGKTDEEKSVVCRTEDVPKNVSEREDGWRAFRIEGVLDFSLTGILAEISALLAEEKIGIFAVSTFNTDYVLVKKENEMKALGKLGRSGYKILTGERYGDYFMNRSVTDIMDEYIEQHDEWNVIR